eukprot:UC1_evm1s1969
MIARKFNCSGCAARLSKRRADSERPCANCESTTPPRIEKVIWAAIEDKLPLPSVRDNMVLATSTTGCAASPTRPDVAWCGNDRIVHLEIDEYSHRYREAICEVKKIDSAGWGAANTTADGRRLPVVMVRYNDDACDTPEVAAYTTKAARRARLVEVLPWAFTAKVTTFDPIRINVVYLFYHSKANRHIEAAKEAVDNVAITVYDGSLRLAVPAGKTAKFTFGDNSGNGGATTATELDMASLVGLAQRVTDLEILVNAKTATIDKLNERIGVLEAATLPSSTTTTTAAATTTTTSAALSSDAITEATIELQSVGLCNGGGVSPFLRVNGANVPLGADEGLQMFVIGAAGTITERKMFKISGSFAARRQAGKDMLTWVQQLAEGTTVAALVYRSADHVQEEGIQAMEALGSALFTRVIFRQAWAMIGRKGAQPGSVPEDLGVKSYDGGVPCTSGRYVPRPTKVLRQNVFFGTLGTAIEKRLAHKASQESLNERLELAQAVGGSTFGVESASICAGDYVLITRDGARVSISLPEGADIYRGLNLAAFDGNTLALKFTSVYDTH